VEVPELTEIAVGSPLAATVLLTLEESSAFSGRQSGWATLQLVL